MTETNSIELWWSKVRFKKLYYILFAILPFFVFDLIITIFFVVIKTEIYNTPLQSYGHRYHLISLFSPTGIPENINVRYVGDYAFSPVAARQWHVADPVLGWRLGRNVGITKSIDLMDGFEDRSFHEATWRITNEQGFAAAGALDFSVDIDKEPGPIEFLF
ncbi:hypothetical protein JCM17960_11360 [Magnetospira thiophila]